MAWWTGPLLAAGIYGMVCLLIHHFQERLIYFPPRGLTATPGDWGMPYEKVTLASAGATIVGWFIPAPPGGDPAGPVVLYLHGNASCLSDCLGHAELFHGMGLAQLLVDYQGYGESGGRPSEQATYADALAAWRHLTETRGIDPRRVVIYGHSLGGGVATWLALRQPPGALVLEGTFTNGVALARERYPWLPVGALLRHRYPSDARLSQLRGVPLLVIHSRDDETIPFHHGEGLLAAGNPPKRLWPTSGSHHEGFHLMPGAARGLTRWLEEAFGPWRASRS